MTRSFRLRIALLSALLSGLVLIAFGGGTWWLVRSIKLERIDSEVRTHAEREVTRFVEVIDWQRPLGRMTTAIGVKNPTDLVLLVQDESGDTVYRSPHWPAGLDSDALPWPVPGVAPVVDSGSWLFASAHAQEPPGGGRPRPGMGGPGGPGGPAGIGGPFPPPRAGNQPPRGVASNASGESAPPPAGMALRLPPPSPASSTSEPVFSAPPLQPPLPPPSTSPGEPATPVTADSGATASEELRPPPGTGLPPPPLESLPPPRRVPPATAQLVRVVDGQEWRIGLGVTDNGRVAIAVNAQVIADDMRSMRNAFLLALPFALVLIGVASWVVASRALKPLRKLTFAARKVTAEGLDQRIATQDEDEEFGELIEVFNRMLERLERSFKQSQRFSADAAHELKTPLAILQGQLERAIQSADDGSPLQAQLSGILDEVRRLSGISRKLLLLSQADAGHMSLLRESFNLSEALDDLIEDTRMLAPHLTVDGNIAPGIVIQADGTMLRQVLHNLISNAIKYNLPDGWVRITLLHWSQRVEVKVSNASAGISATQRKKLFERFFRADAAHSRTVEGVGLGLALAREIARAHGGDITLSFSDDKQVEFSLVLPAR